MGVGHVPQDPLRAPREGADVQGCERRGTASRRAVADGTGAAAHIAVGRQGEELVAEWYRSRGYRILARNWTCRSPEVRGEIDIVAERDGLVVVCEVKTRSSTAYGMPAAAVGPEKQSRLRRLAIAYLRASGARARTVRFDVATVLGDRREVEVITAAF